MFASLSLREIEAESEACCNRKPKVRRRRHGRGRKRGGCCVVLRVKEIIHGGEDREAVADGVGGHCGRDKDAAERGARSVELLAEEAAVKREFNPMWI